VDPNRLKEELQPPVANLRQTAVFSGSAVKTCAERGPGAFCLFCDAVRDVKGVFRVSRGRTAAPARLELRRRRRAEPIVTTRMRRDARF
jgi:hypothetical protein